MVIVYFLDGCRFFIPVYLKGFLNSTGILCN